MPMCLYRPLAVFLCMRTNSPTPPTGVDELEAAGSRSRIRTSSLSASRSLVIGQDGSGGDYLSQCAFDPVVPHACPPSPRRAALAIAVGNIRQAHQTSLALNETRCSWRTSKERRWRNSRSAGSNGDGVIDADEDEEAVSCIRSRSRSCSLARCSPGRNTRKEAVVSCKCHGTERKAHLIFVGVSKLSSTAADACPSPARTPLVHGLSGASSWRSLVPRPPSLLPPLRSLPPAPAPPHVHRLPLPRIHSCHVIASSPVVVVKPQRGALRSHPRHVP
ncbi:hypothetical protein K438DRAFT_1980536 [Mycena galopus ATCC 62051]|nr:hypothetical protein K438DRAFT_1980536 [Mycena galopus ATCC 62051]